MTVLKVSSLIGGNVSVGQPNGIAPLDVNSKVPIIHIPQFVKSDVGLSNVDNTSDLNKPISTATQTALANLESIISSFEMPSMDGLELTVSNGVLNININGQDVSYTILANITQINVIKPISPKIAKNTIYLIQGGSSPYSSVLFPSNWNWINGTAITIANQTNVITRIELDVDSVGNIYAQASFINLG